MKFKNKLLIYIFSLLLIIPINALAYSDYILVGGQTIGIEVNSSGVLVVGFYKINNDYIAKDAGFEVGDIILKINKNEVSDINSMVNLIENSNTNEAVFLIERQSKTKEIKLKLEKDQAGLLKTGLYVKDKINGIGTLTYIDPETKTFGALGHEIIENSTASKFEIKDGKIYNATVTEIIKSRNGRAGEKNAIYNQETIYGKINDNEIAGIFGEYTSNLDGFSKLKVGTKDDITTGNAIIRTVVSENNIEEFKINIIKLDDNSKTKNILFEITDQKLLEKTGGIVQGMSGSPIIQNDKIIGAVNYVIVNDTTKGYGIFITTMLEEGED